jgi:hypothetical protein
MTGLLSLPVELVQTIGDNVSPESYVQRLAHIVEARSNKEAAPSCMHSAQPCDGAPHPLACRH